MLRIGNIAALVFSSACFADAIEQSEGVESITEGQSVSVLDKIWDLPTLYSNPDSDVLQYLSLVGVVQYQYGAVDSSQGSFDDGEFRRFRLGARAGMAKKFLLSASANLDPEEGPFYRRLSTAFISMSPYGNDRKSMEKFQILIGKLKPRFTREYTTSSRRILTFERSLLVNNLAPPKATGIWIGGKSADSLSYAFGVFSGDQEDEFTKFEHGALLIGKLGIDINDDLNVGLDLMASIDDPEIADATSFGISLSSAYNEGYGNGRFGLITDLIFAAGSDDNPDLYGAVLMPSYSLTDTTELVARYDIAYSDGLRLRRRYERSVPEVADGGRGDFFQGVYLGLNHYIHDHKLKLMTGVQYSDMDGGGDGGDFDGWTWFGGVRLFF